MLVDWPALELAAQAHKGPEGGGAGRITLCLFFRTAFLVDITIIYIIFFVRHEVRMVQIVSHITMKPSHWTQHNLVNICV